jgi:hypothetical protein
MSHFQYIVDGEISPLKFDLDVFMYVTKQWCTRFKITNNALDKCFQAYADYKEKVAGSRSENGHYTFCEWSDRNCRSGSDTCMCHHICSYIPRTLPSKFMNAAGLEIIIAIMRAKGYNV